MVVSGWQTVGVIVRNAEAPPAAFVRMRFAPMSETGAALLGCLISLTPGTTTLNVDMARREMLLHLLDASDPDAVIAGIRADFERARGRGVRGRAHRARPPQRRPGRRARHPACRRARALRRRLPRDGAGAAFLVAGGVLLVVAAWGVVRLADALSRQHAATKAGTLALALVCIGAMIHAGEAGWTVRLAVILVFLFATLPVASHLLARAAVRESGQLTDVEAAPRVGDGAEPRTDA